jgi:hypothetical protein
MKGRIEHKEKCRKHGMVVPILIGYYEIGECPICREQTKDMAECAAGPDDYAPSFGAYRVKGSLTNGVPGTLHVRPHMRGKRIA